MMDSQIVSSVVVGVAVVVATVTDLRTRRIPDALTGTLAATCLVVAIVSHTIIAALLGAVATTLPLLLVYAFTRGRGIGLGDVKLGVGIGLGLGALAGFTAIDLAFVIGAVVGVIAIATRIASRKTVVPFAPFIALGTLLEIATHMHEVIFQ